MLDGWADIAHLIELLGAIAVGKKALYLRHLGPVLDILGGEQRRAGDRDGANLHQTKDTLPPFKHARQHHQHTVTFLQPQLCKSVRGAARALSKLGKSDTAFLALLSDPEHSELVRILCPFPHGIGSEV